jgi:hypothetical protein
MAFPGSLRRSRVMKVQTQIKAGGIGLNHNQTLVRK